MLHEVMNMHAILDLQAVTYVQSDIPIDVQRMMIPRYSIHFLSYVDHDLEAHYLFNGVLDRQWFICVCMLICGFFTVLTVAGAPAAAPG
jgi:branched-subunit amino acid transport protein